MNKKPKTTLAYLYLQAYRAYMTTTENNKNLSRNAVKILIKKHRNLYKNKDQKIYTFTKAPHLV